MQALVIGHRQSLGVMRCGIWSLVYIYTGVCLTDLERKPWKALLIQPLSPGGVYTLTSFSLNLLKMSSSFHFKAGWSVISREGHLDSSDPGLMYWQSPRCWYLESSLGAGDGLLPGPCLTWRHGNWYSLLDSRTNSQASLGAVCLFGG